jgi:hypothetical protein
MSKAIAVSAAFALSSTAFAAPPTVPPKYVGDWVAQKSECDAPLRLRVGSRAVTLIDGAQSQSFENVDVCLNCEARVPQGFESVTLTPEAGANKPPIKVRLYSKENKGLAIVSIERDDLKASYALDKVNLRKCAQRTAQQSSTSQPSAAASERQQPVANVDVIGIKLGQSTVAQTRAALAAVTPALRITENRASLLGQSTAGRSHVQPVPIPNSDYVASLQGANDARERESIYVTFSTPPSEGIALSVSRQIGFGQGPLVDSLVRSLIQKYGQPGFHHQFGTNQTYYWAWSESGTPVPLKAHHPCVASFAGLGPHQEWEQRAKVVLGSGCALILHASFGTNAGAVTTLNINAADQASVLAAIRKTGALIAKGVSQFEQEEKAKAAKTAAPRL